jgi:hypothetical protein
MQTYTITVTNYDNQADTSEQNVSQETVNHILDSAAPYNEAQMFADINDPEQSIVFLVDVKTSGEYYRWHGACYSYEVFAAMLTTALKRNVLKNLSETK